VFALACAERLVRTSGAPSDSDLREALRVGWSAAMDGSGDCQLARLAVEMRDDLDGDEVAAVAYALGAVCGDDKAAWGAVSRALDAAFERVEYPEDARSFRPLDEDLATEPVQTELRWQEEALSRLAANGATAEVIDWLGA
jgi:hypothetical protein